MTNLKERAERLRQFRKERDRILLNAEFEEAANEWVRDAMEALTEARIQQEKANLSAAIAREILRGEMDAEAAKSLEELQDHLEPSNSNQVG